MKVYIFSDLSIFVAANLRRVLNIKLGKLVLYIHKHTKSLQDNK